MIKYKHANSINMLLYIYIQDRKKDEYRKTYTSGANRNRS